ncbi:MULTISPECIES: putative bifunctional diguanylate cyclase/phosphodiesterase [Pseudonocardia]|uniref:Phytochrome-like protein cph2 n=2 Tax=Pseudonocardia TaxID=1847 RepID=A0A1Y2N6M1_PSEAH|nr:MULTISPECIES: EAL domain-containing protein [Pseudonocardia]OSY43126.1 Phytochrome-like protein cph2 [Pseudonocardia autotrophica]TDN71614.1 diguanylate cyclase/phosphodiesterase with PAS/PAC sensor(s) [Pseudonocardia autotrophica]BBG02301.1 GGDEF domain-containing protein [Pseudonocardia autotrophica]GEC23363.1 GGDEF domain-containing protein [Pseudonocardia saturnea]
MQQADVAAACADHGRALAAEALPAPSELVSAWTATLARRCAQPAAELRPLLERLTDRMRAAATGESLDPAEVVGVGRELIQARITDPACLEASLTVLGGHLEPGADTGARVRRLAAVQASFVRGFTDALRLQVLADQEQVTRAALEAREVAERARWASETRFSAMFDSAAVGIVIFDPRGRSIEANDAAAAMLGYSREQLTGMSVADFVSVEHAPELWAERPRLLDGSLDRLRVVRPVRRADDVEIWIDAVVTPLHEDDGSTDYLVAVLSDVTEQRELQRRLEHQASHDPLTGLPNRSLFFGRLAAAIAGSGIDGPRPGICYLDLDGFKVVNDTLGHQAGDRLLTVLADRLRAALEPEGYLVARMGGDEFVVLVPRTTDRADLEEIAGRALGTVRRPVRIDGRDIVISASVGVVRHDGELDADELLQAADTTLYSAKRAGRGRYVLYDRERHRSDVRRFELSSQMPEALRRDDFVVVYQPLVRLADEQTVGVEALVRWQRPDGELLGPDRFIPLAEETGLVVPLGRRVLDEACRQGRTWADQHPDRPLLVSVNVAARQIVESDLVADVAATLERHDWPAERLQIELTESDLMGSPGGPPATLRELERMGVRIAIDDFGTGYSNLAYLRHLPVHVLKLAGHFVAGSAERDDVILRTLISLASALDLEVTAEAVETREQAMRLREYGCANAQGWYYAPAVVPERVPELIRDPFLRDGG